MFRGVLKHSIDDIIERQEAQLYSTLQRAAKWLRTGDGYGGSLRSGLGLVREGDMVRRFAIGYMWESFKHLLTGASFLYALGAVGTVFGDGGLFGEAAFQLVLLSSVVLGIRSTAFQRSAGSEFYEAMSRVNKIAKANRWSRIPGVGGLVRLKATYSILGVTGGGALASALALQIGQHVFQAGIVIGRALM